MPVPVARCVARAERQRNPGVALPQDRPTPDFAEFIIGPANGRARWLNPGYASTCPHIQPDKGAMKIRAANPPRQRADIVLVERGLFESRAKAQAAIAAGLVTADAMPVRKASETIAADAALVAEPAFPWVSRGGVKLDVALGRFGVSIADRVCLDVGASTGGFTEVLLARGARRIYAVDVGAGQLHPHLRSEPKIVSLERTDIRALDPARLGEPPDFITIDVSFISLKSVLPAAFALAARPAHALALVKPQFEAPRAHIKKGIVRDPSVHEAVVAEIAACAASLGCCDIVSFPSPIAGGDGNLEFFLGAKLG
jgi:23S rRNA (cytidine1920-2'-O)/16S rRNA (cytidine1409-2'-O)-methyltransferase